MGSDQSSQQGQSRRRAKNPKRSQSAGNDSDSSGRKIFGGSSSPRPSVCSDSDIPYISYATTRPISEDTPSERKSKWGLDVKPKTREKQMTREKRDSKSKSAGSIVVVKAATETPSVEKDPLYLRLMEIPPFTPIIRGSLKIPWTKDPEISEKIEVTPVFRMIRLYAEVLHHHAETVASEQKRLSGQVKELDVQVDSMMAVLQSRQKSFAKYAERLNRINELTNGLSACHCVLNRALESIEVLNNMLAPEDRLEPFVWTTG
ncbi:unnamed protein product [Orchesella dallaii]|uniref:BLOC-1-related complex subunit 5 n=1 Tax=Orchesella dallaii TaxID=48710 RepID=A0ABP1R035_9HEXA